LALASLAASASAAMARCSWTGSRTSLLKGQAKKWATSGVARRHIFQPEILIWVNFGGTWNGSYIAIWSILRPFGLFCDHLVYFTVICLFCGHLVYLLVIWFILWPFGIFGIKFPVLVYLNIKNLATVATSSRWDQCYNFVNIFIKNRRKYWKFMFILFKDKNELYNWFSSESIFRYKKRSESHKIVIKICHWHIILLHN
jgi:hypothetical protein